MKQSISTAVDQRPVYRTAGRYSGRMFCGDAADVLESPALRKQKGKVNLVFTSPPFPLNRKKRYGNLAGDQYVRWLSSFAPKLREFLASDGSIVIELGNGWVKGRPEMSTLPLEALLAFKREGGFYLCQEFIAYNPARLPSPAQWVTVERCRVKDAYTRLWWLSAVEKPKSDNRNVLSDYSHSMRKLLERGTYNAGTRPSAHNIGRRSFLKNNGGSIPPNLLVDSVEDVLPDFLERLPALHGVIPVSNTDSYDPYQRYCRENGIELHPARMPGKLVRFFINFLTEPGDLVLDPFAGSNMTGFIAGTNQRRWISIEKERMYALSSASRFESDPSSLFH